MGSNVLKSLLTFACMLYSGEGRSHQAANEILTKLLAELVLRCKNAGLHQSFVISLMKTSRRGT